MAIPMIPNEVLRLEPGTLINLSRRRYDDVRPIVTCNYETALRHGGVWSLCHLPPLTSVRVALALDSGQRCEARYPATSCGCGMVQIEWVGTPSTQNTQSVDDALRATIRSLFFSDRDPRENSQGQYLCETCFDAMTNRVVTLDGLEQAQCEVCAHG